MDTEELLRRLRECEGRKSQYMQKEPPERLPGPESAPSQYMQKMPPPERLPGPDPYGPDPFGLDAPPPPERLPGPDSDPFGLGPDPYAGKDLYDLPPDVAREIERRRGIKSRFANPGPPSINGSHAQPKASPAPSGYGSKRKDLPAGPIALFGGGMSDDRNRNGIDDSDEQALRDRMLEEEYFRRNYNDHRQNYGFYR